MSADRGQTNERYGLALVASTYVASCRVNFHPPEPTLLVRDGVAVNLVEEFICDAHKAGYLGGSETYYKKHIDFRTSY